jgi:molecular chaperone DnaK (HSP70)
LIIISNIKKGISDRFNKEINYSLNAEECIAKGAVLYGALNSCSVKIKDYKIENTLELPINIKVGNKMINVSENNLTLPSTKSIKYKLNMGEIKELEIYLNNKIYSKYNIDLDFKYNTKIELHISIDLNRIIRIIKMNYLDEQENVINISLEEPNVLSDDMLKDMIEKERNPGATKAMIVVKVARRKKKRKLVR